MGFTIECYRRSHLEGMLAVYHQETAFEPHIARLSHETFIELVEAKRHFDPQGLLVAVEKGQVVGWVHACVAPGSEPHHDPQQRVPQIRMLIFSRDRLPVGAALVAEATRWLRRASAGPLLALHAQHGYPFYRGLWLGAEPMGPATMPHVQLALEVAGYQNTQESVFMTATINPPLTPPLSAAPVELVESAAELRHEGMRESWIGFRPMRTRALVGGEEVGSVGWVVIPHLRDTLGAPAVNIWSLGVAQGHRRRGIATWLLAHTLARGYEQGARFASVGTQLWNAPAHATYAKLGFSPHCIVVGRTLSGRESEND